MEWLRIGTAALFFLVVLGSSARAQEVETVVVGDATNPSAQTDTPPVLVTPAPPASPPSEPADPATGWAALGVELGLVTGVLSFAALAALTDDGGWGGAGAVVALTWAAGGGLAFYHLAGEGEWDGGLGWALAAIVPGAVYGLLAGTLAAIASEEVGEEPALALSIGAASGALLFAPMFGAFGYNGQAILPFVGLWAGMLGGALIGLPFALGFEDPTSVLVGSLVGGMVQMIVGAILE
jgi:hypothetical protein